MNSKTVTNSNLLEIISVLKKGGVAIFPTDTVYTIGASIKQPEALKKIFKIKERNITQSLPLLISRPEVALEIADIQESAMSFFKKIWPSCWTFILKAKVQLNPGLVGPDGTVALRCPNHSEALEILRSTGETLAVSSANISGEKSPIRFEEVAEELIDQVDIVLDAGPTSLGGQSAIARLTDQKFELIRSGCVSEDEIQRVQLLFENQIK
jgi:L-threonylcarbamoyladenylate synthase